MSTASLYNVLTAFQRTRSHLDFVGKPIEIFVLKSPNLEYPKKLRLLQCCRVI